MATVQISTVRPAIEVTQQDGSTVKWDYDVVELKLLIEKIERNHGIRVGDKLGPPTQEFFRDFARFLQEDYQFANCNSDIAYRLFFVVNAQFNELSKSVNQQIADYLVATQG